MTVDEMLCLLVEKARENDGLKQRLLETAKKPGGLADFCRIVRAEGIPLYEMELIDAGEEAYAAMKRSTNGGGENSPRLVGQDDYYEQCIDQLKEI